MPTSVPKAEARTLPHLARPRSDPRHADTGFTLVELMVVLVIMGLAATAVVMTLPDSGNAVREEADRLAIRLAAARDLAVVEGRGTAAVISPSGYSFEQRVRGEWQTVQGRAFTNRDWPADIRFGGGDQGGQARILFSRVGTSPTPQTVEIRKDDRVEAIHVAASGEISRDR